MKTITLTPVGGELDLATGTALVEGLLAKQLNVQMACGGRGVCASCHVFLRAGRDAVSPITAREERTLGLVATSTPDSRLACQCRVQGEGVVVEVPAGLYVHSLDGLDKLIGDRAGYDYLHPITGRTLIPTGKIITRTVFQEFSAAAKELAAARDAA